MNVPHLEVLKLKNNEVSDISVFLDLKLDNLKEINLNSNKITDIAPFEQC